MVVVSCGYGEAPSETRLRTDPAYADPLSSGAMMADEPGGPSDQAATDNDVDGPQAATAGQRYDVVVYGGGSAGVAAVVAAARRGADVVLVHDIARVGGMITNGVTRTDIVKVNGVSGFYEDFRQLVASTYFKRGSEDFELSKHIRAYGLEFEPDVALDAIEQLLASVSFDRVHGYLPDQGGVTHQNGRIESITVVEHRGRTREIHGRMFIDASDAGDLIGQAGERGVDWVVGRESRSEYGESLAGEYYKDGSGSGQSDHRMQAYNYRFTIQKGGRTDYIVPADYLSNLSEYRRNRNGYECEIDGKVYRQMQVQACLPGKKIDINVDKIGANHDYPVASRMRRKQIEQELRDYAIGYLHFIRTELGHPELGLPDDYPQNGNFPENLYVREGRRLLGRYVMRQDDVLRESLRGRVFSDAIAMGEYGCDSHCVQWIGGQCEGGFWKGTKPYQIPYRAIIPRRFDNLLVPHAASATHVAYASVRMEPVRTSLGTASGIAAVLANDSGRSVANIDIAALQSELIDRRQALIYFSDVAPGDPAFPYVQRIAMRGAMLGYEDYRFGPSDELTRAHAAVVLQRAFAVPSRVPSRASFSDVPSSHWAYTEIESLKAAGVIDGYADGTFRPAASLTRAQLVKLVAVLGDLSAGSGAQRFSDVPTTHWAFAEIEGLAQLGVLEGYGDGTFRPDQPATRFHAAKLIEETLRALGR